MYVINTKGFNTKEKVEITKNYLLPELMKIFMFNDNEINFNESNIEYIINNYTGKEEGVRNLKRSIETIISKINIYNLSYDEDKKEAIDLTYQIKDFKLPLEMNNGIIDSLLKTKKSDGPPSFMYM
jgi:ATP-dependent Lon protease